MASTGLYEQLIWELRKAIIARGMTMQQCDDASGNQDGYTAKMLHPDTAQGRQASWEMLEYLMRAIYPTGFRLRVKSRKALTSNGLSLMEKAHTRGGAGRIPIRDLASYAGQRSGEVRKSKIPSKKRIRIARHAAKARWRRPRVVEVMPGRSGA